MAGMPVSSDSQRDSSPISAIAPCTVESGCSGCMSPKPGSRAIFSLRRGLCFIVHEPEREDAGVDAVVLLADSRT